MKELIKTVALEVAEKFFDPEMDADHAARYVEACIAELCKRAEAVAYVDEYYGLQRTRAGIDLPLHAALFTFPPLHDIKTIENRVAEACSRVCEEVRKVVEIDSAIHACDAIRSGEWRKYK